MCSSLNCMLEEMRAMIELESSGEEMEGKNVANFQESMWVTGGIYKVKGIFFFF